MTVIEILTEWHQYLVGWLKIKGFTSQGSRNGKQDFTQEGKLCTVRLLDVPMVIENKRFAAVVKNYLAVSAEIVSRGGIPLHIWGNSVIRAWLPPTSDNDENASMYVLIGSKVNDEDCYCVYQKNDGQQWQHARNHEVKMLLRSAAAALDEAENELSNFITA